MPLPVSVTQDHGISLPHNHCRGNSCGFQEGVSVGSIYRSDPAGRPTAWYNLCARLFRTQSSPAAGRAVSLSNEGEPMRGKRTDAEKNRKSASTAERTHIVHPFPPTWNGESEILILGSFPSVKSRANGYFYGHPQNRFWRVLALLFSEPCPVSNEDKKAFLLRHHIAAWDVIASCEISGSSDSSIRNVVPNDLSTILTGSGIRGIFCNGQTSYRLYSRYLYPITGREAVCLPSTSPANAAWTLEKLTDAWSVIKTPD